MECIPLEGNCPDGSLPTVNVAGVKVASRVQSAGIINKYIETTVPHATTV